LVSVGAPLRYFPGLGPGNGRISPALSAALAIGPRGWVVPGISPPACVLVGCPYLLLWFMCSGCSTSRACYPVDGRHSVPGCPEDSLCPLSSGPVRPHRPSRLLCRVPSRKGEPVPDSIERTYRTGFPQYCEPCRIRVSYRDSRARVISGLCIPWRLALRSPGAWSVHRRHSVGPPCHHVTSAECSVSRTVRSLQGCHKPQPFSVGPGRPPRRSIIMQVGCPIPLSSSRRCRSRHQ